MRLRSSRGGASSGSRRETGDRGGARRPRASSEKALRQDASSRETSASTRDREWNRASRASATVRWLDLSRRAHRGPDRRARDPATGATGLERFTEHGRTLVGSAILTFVFVVGTCDVREVLWEEGCEKSAAFRLRP